MPILNRFGVSLLSKSRKDEAENEEVMINKSTGEILVKSSSGIITSYDKHARFKSHLDNFTSVCYAKNQIGSIYNIEIESLDLPSLIVENTNLLTDAMLMYDQQIKSMIFSVDADMFAIDITNENEINVNPPLVYLDITFFRNITNPSEYKITRTLDIGKNNVTPFYPIYPSHAPGDTVSFDIIINNIKIKRHTLDSLIPAFNFIYHSSLAVFV